VPQLKNCRSFAKGVVQCLELGRDNDHLNISEQKMMHLIRAIVVFVALFLFHFFIPRLNFMFCIVNRVYNLDKTKTNSPVESADSTIK